MSIDNKLQIRHIDGKVVFIFNGKAAFAGPVSFELADLIAREATRCARLAEEVQKANLIIYDNAILQRSGAPIGLSSHPLIRDETVKTALYDRNLRRYQPARKNSIGMGNIQSKGAVGAPSLTKNGAA